MNVRFNEVYPAFRVKVDKVAAQNGTTSASDFASVYEEILARPEIRGSRARVDGPVDLKDLKYEESSSSTPCHLHDQGNDNTTSHSQLRLSKNKRLKQPPHKTLPPANSNFLSPQNLALEIAQKCPVGPPFGNVGNSMTLEAVTSGGRASGLYDTIWILVMNNRAKDTSPITLILKTINMVKGISPTVTVRTKPGHTTLTMPPTSSRAATQSTASMLSAALPTLYAGNGPRARDGALL
ncbi:hypothetical protein DL765_007620 [Monosporascus sp. GIB2]|nr:hypothetical protein DL765_007620 [Monosporascus sp. GIB2]